MRESWRRFFELLGVEGFADLDRRLDVVARQIHENGMTYTVYADEGPPRPWSLDLLPFVVEDAEWREIEAGVAQRAALLEAIARRRVRAADADRRRTDPVGAGLRTPGLPARDARRRRAGRRAAAHRRVRSRPRTRRPMERRLATDAGAVGARLRAREPADDLATLPGSVQRPAACSISRRAIGACVDMLETLVLREGDTMFDQPAPRDADREQRAAARRGRPTTARERVPRIVLLTPGPYNETYFEHAYLARYLGLPLVEGSDLTVRDERVYLKTMRGLERVHGILRRLDDDFCDPVELRSESTIGVPGLLQAIRARHVLVANALGCGFLESPALNGFLPAISRRLRGRGAAAAVAVVVVVRRGRRARRGRCPTSRERVVKPTYPAVDRPTRLRAADRRRPRAPSQLDAWQEAHRRRSRRVHGAGPPAAVAGADLGRRTHRAARGDAARLRDRRGADRRSDADATVAGQALARVPRRARAHREPRSPDRVDAARRLEPRHVGAHDRADRRVLDAAGEARSPRN